ncbi:MAG: hypothetical protein E6Q97_32895 [Desulfurellales bacterium]|nr:MAG: hypothetical protein E6Q97_32895 [Desulfurellales bacterium]
MQRSPKTRSTTSTPTSTYRLTQDDRRLLQSLNRSDLEVWLRDLASVDPVAASEIRVELGVPEKIDYSGRGRAELMEFFGISGATLDNWMNQGMPVEYRAGKAGGWSNPNKYNLQDVARWLHNKRSGGAPDQESARVSLQIKQEKARALELKRLSAEGTLVDAHEARQATINVCVAIRRALEKLHSTYGSQLVAAMTEVVDAARKELFGEDTKD